MEQEPSKENFTKAIRLIKEGKKKEGGEILIGLAKANPNDENIWLWLAVCVNNNDKKKEFLKKVLKINPDNQIAKEGLEKIIRLEMQPDLTQKISQENENSEIHHINLRLPPKKSKIVIVGGVVLIAIAIIFTFFRNNLPFQFAYTATPTDISSRCTSELLNKVRKTVIHNSYDEYLANLGPFSEDFMQIVHLDNLRNIKWDIEERGEDGCVITMTGEKNSTRYELLRFYLDLKVGKISADNQDTQYIFESFGQTRYLGGVYLNNGR